MVKTINQDRTDLRPNEQVSNIQLRQMIHGLAEHKMHLVEQSGIRDQFAEAVSLSNRELESTENDLRHVDPDDPKYGLPDDTKVDHYFNTVADNLGVDPALMANILIYVALDEAEQTASDNYQELAAHESQGLDRESYVPYIARHNLDVFAEGYVNIYGEPYDAAESLRQENIETNTYDAPTILSDSLISNLNNVNLGLGSDDHIASTSIPTETTYMNQELPRLSAEAQHAREDFSYAYELSSVDLTDEEEMVNDKLLIDSMERMIENKLEIQEQSKDENIIISLDGQDVNWLNSEYVKADEEFWQGITNKDLTEIDGARQRLEKHNTELQSFRTIAESEFPDALRDIKPLIIVEDENAFDSIVASASVKNLVNNEMIELLDGLKDGRSPKNEVLGDAFHRQIDIMSDGWGVKSDDLMADPNLFQDWMAQTIEQTVENSPLSDVQHIDSQKVDPFLVMNKVFDKENPIPDMEEFREGYTNAYSVPIDAVHLTMAGVYEAVGNDPKSLPGVQGLLNYKDVLNAKSSEDLAALTTAVEIRIKNEQKPSSSNSSYSASNDDGPEM